MDARAAEKAKTSNPPLTHLRAGRRPSRSTSDGRESKPPSSPLLQRRREQDAALAAPPLLLHVGCRSSSDGCGRSYAGRCPHQSPRRPMPLPLLLQRMQVHDAAPPLMCYLRRHRNRRIAMEGASGTLLRWPRWSEKRWMGSCQVSVAHVFIQLPRIIGR